MRNLSWLQRVERRVKRWSSAQTAWVVAVSGGSDSVGLLRVLQSTGMSLVVAHLDHGARGEEAKEDAAFVEELAASLGVPFELGQWKATRSAHFESDARRARYAWLVEVTQKWGAEAVAVGHTRDDQAETVLHRLIRGTGVLGLAGIPARRRLAEGVMLVRPLLDVSRQDVRAYLAERGQGFREDRTNADTTRTRARIRHDLLPKLAGEYNPNVAEALVRLARLAKASERVRRETIAEIERVATIVDTNRDELRFHRDRLSAVPGFLRAEVLRSAWRRAGWPEAGMSARRWRRLARAVRTSRGGRFDVGEGIEAVIEPTVLRLRRSSVANEPVAGAVALEIPGAASWQGGQVVSTLDIDATLDEIIDLDRLVPPLVVRGPVPGDRFGPLGMGDHEMALNDFFRGRRVSRGSRRNTPLVCDGLGIVWVVGHRIADRVRLTEGTARRVVLRWEHGCD